ncbi:glutaminase A [Schnuerera ultunensis]|uniref:glutaminase A n=1 Tax=Schnuerera ultunensis TaxID=45497 RepID=UPI0004208B00|nr:glutaminase A [Schnuerera ultunensis]
MKELLDGLVEKNKALIKYGQVANYIPLLGNADPKDLGVCIIDNLGNIYSSGIYNKKFTIQSISKVIALMLAIMDKGEEEVFKKVGMEPTDEPFNSLYKLDIPYGDKPANPMINAGAIVTTSLINGNGEEKLNRLLEFLRKITGNDTINYNEEVYLSEKTTGNKNKAIAYLLKNKGLIEEKVEDILDIYFKQCSIEMDCQDIAKIGIFLANKGRVLNTGEKLLDNKTNSTIIAIMTTSGMYDFSGEYAVRVGIPSKSGVSGGILASVPNRLGIGVYGPALDQYGNSIAGYGILKDLSEELNLSIFT